MAISRFQSRFKTRTDLMDNITPNNVVQMNASVPHGEWKPASWLPVVWQNEKSKDYFTISAGKIVSFDASGRIVPSGLLRRCLDASNKTDVVLSYLADDVTARVIDIMTGEFVTAAKNVTLAQFITAASQHGWIHTDISADTLAAYQEGAKDFISAPVGVAAYDVYVWAGDDPANLHFTNYQKQHLIQFFSDVQMRVAHVCKSTASTYTVVDNHLQTGAQMDDSTHANFKPGLAGVDLTNIVALDLGLGKVCSNQSETPVTFTNWAGNRERSDISLLGKAGDWWLDADAGVIYFYETGGNALPVDSNGDLLNNARSSAINVFVYAAGASSQEKMMHLVGDGKPGDFVTFDENSNFKVRSLSLTLGNDTDGTNDAATNAAAVLSLLQESEDYTVGRIYELQKEPRGLLERVRTGFSGSEFGADAKMPGSATKGFSDLITLSDEIVSDEIAIINVKIQ